MDGRGIRSLCKCIDYVGILFHPEVEFIAFINTYSWSCTWYLGKAILNPGVLQQIIACNLQTFRHKDKLSQLHLFWASIRHRVSYILLGRG